MPARRPGTSANRWAITESVDLVINPVLDAGCGTGENALFLAANGHQVTGIDFVDEAIPYSQNTHGVRP
jgi:2-polyprenyl-3-methyl-5-hydroxy-6-metoxy-1,4-benzoquinol methylase